MLMTELFRPAGQRLKLLNGRIYLSGVERGSVLQAGLEVCVRIKQSRGQQFGLFLFSCVKYP